jgi:two-component system response regulator RegA
VSDHLLIVEDDEPLRAQLARAFRGRGYAISEARSLGALAALSRAEWSAAVVDLRLPDGSGLEAVERLREMHAALPIVVLTGYGSIASALEAVRLGAVDYLTKPVDVDQILSALGGSLSGAADAATAPQTPSLERVEWEHIQRVLRDCDGNVSRAAKVLRIHRRTLQRKLSYRPPER